MPGDPAPGTDGRRCLDGFEDYDDDPENGCEAEDDGLGPVAELTEEDGEAEGTIVPRDEIDVWLLPGRRRDRPRLLGSGHGDPGGPPGAWSWR